MRKGKSPGAALVAQRWAKDTERNQPREAGKLGGRPVAVQLTQDQAFDVVLRLRDELDRFGLTGGFSNAFTKLSEALALVLADSGHSHALANLLRAEVLRAERKRTKEERHGL